MTDRLTGVVDDLECKMGQFKHWSVPGDTMAAATLDFARTVCRRAERRVAALMESEVSFNAEILRYLNRLSDLCWLLARYAERLQDRAESPGEKR
jgi:cob(I)alamin adenosyltransferase